KTLLSFALMVGVVALTGCTDKSKPGGGDDKKEQFNISVKDTFKQGKDVKQGEKVEIPIKVERGKEFKEPVKLSVDDKDVPKGVKVSFEPAEVSADKHETDMVVEVDKKESATGKQTIKVHAKPEKGSATTLDVSLNIKEKE